MTTNIQGFIIEAKANGGGSYNLNTGNTNPNKGYMVSIEGCEEIHKEFPTDEKIREYVLTHSELLAMDDKYLGIWYNDKKQQWYLDVSINISNRGKARLFGSINKQIAIWDCANGKEIKLDEDEYYVSDKPDGSFAWMVTTQL